MDLISIALCTYNGERYIEEQLLSILSQSYSNLEIIISDDCSTDNTLSIIKRFQKSDSRIKLYEQEMNIGFNHNFKKALDLCSGSYIAIADQDDIWDKRKLDKMKNLIKADLLLYHDSAYIDEMGKSTKKSSLSEYRFVKGDCSQHLLFNNCVSGHACLIHIDLLKITPEFPQKMYYDWWLAYTAACCARINFTTEKLVAHRKHRDSITRNDKLNDRMSRMQKLRLFFNHPLTPPATYNLLNDMLLSYNILINKKASFSLLSILVTNYPILFYTRKRSLFSNLKFILKESGVIH